MKNSTSTLKNEIDQIAFDFFFLIFHYFVFFRIQTQRKRKCDMKGLIYDGLIMQQQVAFQL